MTDCKRVFIDTAPFIYYIEKNVDNPQYFDKVKRFLMKCYEENIQLVTSVITMEEYMVFPYRNNKLEYIDLFEGLLQALEFDVLEIDEKKAKKASRIRADYKAFKGMDALQLATACETKCDLFLTNDKQLKQFAEVKCITVDELE